MELDVTQRGLLERMRDLGQFRRESAELTQELTTQTETFNAQESIVTLKAALTRVGERIRDLDTGIRAEAMTLYNQTLTKEILGKAITVKVRVKGKVTFETVAALAWAKAHDTCLLLDDRAYGALVGLGQAPGDTEDVPSINLAGDIPKAIEELEAGLAPAQEDAVT